MNLHLFWYENIIMSSTIQCMHTFFIGIIRILFLFNPQFNLYHKYAWKCVCVVNDLKLFYIWFSMMKIQKKIWSIKINFSFEPPTVLQSTFRIKVHIFLLGFSYLFTEKLNWNWWNFLAQVFLCNAHFLWFTNFNLTIILFTITILAHANQQRASRRNNVVKCLGDILKYYVNHINWKIK